MPENATAPVYLLKWDGSPARTIQDAVWKLEDRDDSTNRLSVTTSLAEADGVESEQELVFKGRRFSVAEVDRDRDLERAVIHADEVQAELADLILVNFSSNSWTLEQATEAALSGTRWTLGQVNGIRYGRAHFEDISRLDALKFLARHQDSRLSFDSLRRRVNITATAGTIHETVFTYGRQLTNIEKQESAPTCTVIYPTGADGMTVTGAVLDDGQTFGQNYVEDYGYYTAKGLTLSQARARYKKEDYWEDNRYEVPENMLRDAQKRLAEEAYPQISYTLTAAVTYSEDDGTPEVDDFGISELALGDQVYVWDQEIDTKLRAEVTAITTSSDSSENQVTLAYLPDSLGAGVEGRYFGDSGSVSNGDRGRSGFQPRPSMPILMTLDNLGSATFRWNGQDHDGNSHTIPARFGSIETVVVKLEADGSIPSPDSPDAFGGTRIDTRGGGITYVGFGGGGEFAVWFYMLGRDAQTRSEYSEPLVVDVPELVDTGAIQDDIDYASGRLDDMDGHMADYDTNIQLALNGAEAARVTANELRDETLPALDARLVDNEIALTIAEGTLEGTRLNMENLRDVKLPDLETALTSGIQSVEQKYARLAITGASGNLFSDPDFSDLTNPAGYWVRSADGLRFERAMLDGVPSLSLPNPSVDAGTATAEFYTNATDGGVPAVPDENFRVSCTAAPTSFQVEQRIVLRFRSGYRGAVLKSVWGEWTTTSGAQFYVVEGTAPDSPSFLSVEFQVRGDVTGRAHFTNPVMVRQVDGELLVDGTIGADKIIANEIAAAVGQFLQISAEQIDTENLAAYLATIIELDADQITSGTISTARLDAETVAAAVANFLTLDALEINFEQLAGEIANIIEITSESIMAGSIETRHLAIADFENLLNDDALWEFRASGLGSTIWRDGLGGAAGWTTFTDQAQGPIVLRYDTSGHTAAGSSSLRFTPSGKGIPVRPGDSFYVEAETWVNAASAGNLRLRARYTDEAGGNVFRQTIGTISNGGIKYEWTVPANTARRRMDLEFWAESDAGGNAQIGSIRLRRKHGAELLVDGAVLTRHLTVTEDMTAALGQFLRIEAGSLASNEIEAMNIVGGTVEGATLRGNLIETHSANNRGVKLDNSGIRAWDSGGNQRFSLSSSTGNMTATGIFRTAFSGDMAQLDSDTFGGRLSFYRGNHTGTLKLNNTLNRFEMVYSDGSSSTQERPNVGVEQDRAILGYRQTQIIVGGTTVENQAIRINGSIRGSVSYEDYIEMQRGARVRYHDNLNRTLATVGQSPSSGSSSDFQIWLERGALRVANGGMFLPSAYTTTSSTSANVYISASGWLSRATSASRYKLDQRELTVPDTVLDVPVIDWIDKAATEFKAEMDAKPRPLTQKEQQQYDTINLRRIPGVVAETVVEYGGDQFVVYGADGQVEEVMYDRLGLAQIQVLKRIVKDQGERIAALEGAA